MRDETRQQSKFPAFLYQPYGAVHKGIHVGHHVYSTLPFSVDRSIVLQFSACKMANKQREYDHKYLKIQRSVCWGLGLNCKFFQDHH